MSDPTQTDAKDLPALQPGGVAEPVRKPLQRLTEEVRRLLGFSGNRLDMAVTWRQLYAAGLVELSAVLRGGAGSPPGTITLTPGEGDAYEPDLTPPPSVTGLGATAGITQVVVTWDVAGYTVGHGPARVNLYVAQRAPGDPMAVFAEATLFYEATHPLTIAALALEANTRVHIWAKHQTVDGVESASPAGGTNGVIVTTGQDVTQLLAILSGQITESQLFSTLATRIDLIDNSAAGSVNARIADEASTRAAALLLEASTRATAITTEATTRQTADLALAEQITLITAGAGEQFDYATIYYFDTGVDGWTGNGAPSASASLIIPAIHATTTYIESPTALNVNGTAYTTVKLRLKKFGTPTWAPAYVQWKNSGGSYSANVGLTEPTWDANGFGVCTVQVAWSGTIDQVRLGFGTTTGSDYYGCDWFAIGRAAPGASTAALAAEISARASADSAEVTARETLASQMRGSYTGTDIGSVTTGLLYSEKLARTTQDTAIASSVTALTATVASNLSTVNASITSEASTRASADTAISSTVSTLTSTVSSNLATVNAAISTEATTRANADTAISSTVSTLSATVGSNSAAITAEVAARAALDGSVHALYTVRAEVTAGGRTVVGGYGLAATSTVAEGPRIDFGVRADRFWIGAPGDGSAPGVTDVLPFVVQTNDQTINGVLVPKGVYMDAAFIKNVTAIVARLGTAWIDNAMVANMSVAKLTAGSMAVGAHIQSTNYVANTSGFRIAGDGTLEAAQAIIRGAVFASSGTFAGSLVAATGTFAGALSAATGTFAGALSAASGTFAGTLSSADGTFTGNLSAATGTLGTIELSPGGHIRLGQSSYNVGTGFWLGADGGVPKFSIGSPAGANLRWDGTNLLINNATLDTFSAAISGGNISLSVASGAVNYGSRSVTVTGGRAPFTYFWAVTLNDVRFSSIGQVLNAVWVLSGASGPTAEFVGRNNGQSNQATAACFVRDANGREAMALLSINVTHAFDPGAGE